MAYIEGGEVALKIETALKSFGLNTCIDNVSVKTLNDKGSVDGVSMNIGFESLDLLVKTFLTGALKSLEKENSMLSEILETIDSDKDKIIDTVLSVLSEEKKENIIKTVLKEKKDNICNMIAEALKKEGIIITITEVAV